MSAITYDQIKIASPWKIQTIYQLSIRKTLNNHAELYLSALINESDASKAGLQETTEDMIKVYTDDGATKSWLFKGYLKDVNISVSGGLYNLTARFLSETVILDKEQKSRSFQNTNLTYSDIVNQLLSDYPNKSAEMSAAKTKIDGPLIQYQETDWQFIKRLASLQQTVIVPDVTVDDRIFSYGYPTGYGKTLPDDINYSSGKDINAYFTDSEANPNLIENEYAYFEVESYDELTFGDKVTFHNYEMVVGEVTIELKQGLLIHSTKLVRPMTLRQNPIYNEKIQGISLDGKVLDVKNQEVKLHLAIDKEQDEGTAYWYPFAPPTVDMMYLMPQIGTNASLYIPGLNEQNAVITGCVRTNGESCEKTGDPSTRYLGTDYGQEMKLAPGGIYFTAGRNDLILTFDDEEGVKIASHEGIVLEAKEEIIFDSKTKVIVNSPNQIKMTTPTGGLSVENEIHFNDIKTIIECADESELPLVEQKLDPKVTWTENTQVNWGGLISAAKGAIAKWWNNIQWKEVALGAVQAGGGLFQIGLGVEMFQIGAVATMLSSGLAAVPGMAFAGAGAYVAVDGVNSFMGGISRVGNGFMGNKDGDTWNVLKKLEGETFYNGTQLVIGAYSIKQVVNAGFKNAPNGADALIKYGYYLDKVTESAKSFASHNFDLINFEETLRSMLPKKENPAN
ncbi:hypothetical protein Ga0466249_001882 [Sporomusaceae bacterium BoRhaA]|uniref:contractile injection system protein, VgrG/Pvc8 family n=1 Tax=Pelorhabdus rhamnosifermentans TaxID=2772457 RepID=UPI001C063908|nr:contractile injection system protein, VgrG/Pvc8 family [Pelorhabdus rhamnosifermentans]MBU2700777.1 hypothetical protein [Pelorhabdus rhamnosifermentans]